MWVLCRFNPIAPTLMMKALQALLARVAAGGMERQMSREVLEMIVGTSNGDIRSALMALQFACIAPLRPKSEKSKTKGSRGRKAVTGNGSLAVLEAVTRREQSLVLFHLMGKLLYNKRASTYFVIIFPVDIVQVNMILPLTVSQRKMLRRSAS